MTKKQIENMNMTIKNIKEACDDTNSKNARLWGYFFALYDMDIISHDKFIELKENYIKY